MIPELLFSNIRLIFGLGMYLHDFNVYRTVKRSNNVSTNIILTIVSCMYIDSRSKFNPVHLYVSVRNILQSTSRDSISCGTLFSIIFDLQRVVYMTTFSKGNYNILHTYVLL